MELVHLNKIDFDAFICYVLKLTVHGGGEGGAKWERGWFKQGILKGEVSLYR